MNKWYCQGQKDGRQYFWAEGKALAKRGKAENCKAYQTQKCSQLARVRGSDREGLKTVRLKVGLGSSDGIRKSY